MKFRTALLVIALAIAVALLVLLYTAQIPNVSWCGSGPAPCGF